MDTEFIIIISIVAIIFVAFEVQSAKQNRKLIEKYKQHIEEQEKYIKQLEKDYMEQLNINYQNLKNQLNGK
ncbi:hypothetical protein MKJ01_05515 [Chryseobacterium sp. SSA4.19]|uniref:hypothetical protein n=1 Tax=Chryseobacterium sp. SSA4.19 TaxID=2919915 RepID=UPI001F4EE397|nr:hypothetical protein [Chryseobacterium sp. SSA4.19]MCJ8153219.1 hypothetical protein [Chryseobacterium sp. SSA4.19]